MKTAKAVKKQQKATAIKQGALQTFTKAIEEVNRANDLLANSIDLDETELAATAEEIQSLFQKEDNLSADIAAKKVEIKANNELIKKLKAFSI